MDDTLRGLLAERRGVAVVALGGYARRELCPASDVDLLLLHDGWGRTDLEGLVETLCYPLWDARLTVGHSVRTAAQAVSDASGRIDTATALLDRRLVAGDGGLFDALTSRVNKWARRNATSLLTTLAGADEVRHRAAGTHPGMLEPDVKNGAGGLRDIHSLRWAARLLLGELGLDPLVAAGYVGADDRRRLADANELLLRVRCVLHSTATTAGGKSADVLRLDRQDEVAAALSSPDAPVDADQLLRRVGLEMRTVAHLSRRTWDLILTDASRGRRRRRAPGRVLDDGLRLDGGLVDVNEPIDLASAPSTGLRAVAVAATHASHLSRRSAVGLAAAVAEAGALPWDDAARSALVRLLHAGDGAAEGLAEADHLGLLSAHIPEWSRVRGRPQRNALHRFDLDTHGAEAVVALHSLRHDDRLQRLWHRLRDPDSLVLATWLHDVGKAWPGDHSDVGAQVVQRWLEHMGFERSVGTAVATLVRHHLLLPDVATRHDLDDPDVIHAVASTVGDIETLDALYLLSLADGRATGPSAWSAWKDRLMATLHERVRALLLGESVDPTEDPRLEAVARGASADAVDALTDEAPPSYFDTADVHLVAAHAELLARPERTGAVVTPGVVPDTMLVAVAAKDREGLLADCTGVLAAADLEVLEARATTGPGGMAFDWFTVTGTVDVEDLTEHLEAALDDRIDVDALVSRPRRRPSDGRILRRGATVTVQGGNRIEVEAPDRPALLYYLCRAIADAGYALTAVRASTLGPSVFDVFEIDAAGARVDLEGLRAQLTEVADTSA